MLRGRAYGALAAALALAGCAPLSVPQAERACYAQYAPRAPLSGEGAMGVTSGGDFRSKVEVTINLGAAYSGDPSAAYTACVKRRSGQMPSRPFWTLAGGRP